MGIYLMWPDKKNKFFISSGLIWTTLADKTLVFMTSDVRPAPIYVVIFFVNIGVI